MPESDCPSDLMFVKTGQYCSDDISKSQRALRRSCGNMTEKFYAGIFNDLKNSETWNTARE
eukprot:15334398-Ditylum_brightwellii.AAC.1